MLYDFHKIQNAKKSNSVHGTYLLTGTPRTDSNEFVKKIQRQDDGDSIMQSSPFPSSYPEPEPALEFEDEDVYPVEENIPTTMVALVTEEGLEGACSCLNYTRTLANNNAEAKEEFDEINTICLYSLQSGTPRDLNILSESNREALNTIPAEDPLEVYKQYGVVQNPKVRVRYIRN